MISYRVYFVGGPGEGIQLRSRQADPELIFQEVTGYFQTSTLHKYQLTKADLENRLLVYNYVEQESTE